jgi:hypothetical protein
MQNLHLLNAMLKPTMLFNLHIMDVSNVVSSPQFVLPTLTPQKYALPTRPSPNALQQKNFTPFHSLLFTKAPNH